MSVMDRYRKRYEEQVQRRNQRIVTATDKPDIMPDDAPPADLAPAWAWDTSPATPPRPTPIALLVVGEPGVGKTHLACSFPGPICMIDTDLRGDQVISKLRALNPDKPFYRKIPSAFIDVRIALTRFFSIAPTGGGTVIIDSASDLNFLIEEEVVSEAERTNKKLHHTLHWGVVYSKFSKLCEWIRAKGHNIVFTGKLSDEYVNDKRTGERTPSSFITNKVRYQADFAVEIVVQNDVRTGRVMKNAGRKPGTYREVLTDDELTYEGIVRAMEGDSEAVSNIKAAASLISSATDRLIAAASVEAPDAPEAKSEPDPNEPHGTSPSVDPDLIEAIAEIERLASFFPNYRSEPSRIWDGLVARGKATGHRSISLANAYEVIETLGKTLAAQGVRVH